MWCGHFADCIRAIRHASPATRIEAGAGFRGRLDRALADPASHTAGRDEPQPETVPRLTAVPVRVRLHALAQAYCGNFRELVPSVPTKSGLMVGLGETDEEILR